MGNFSNSSATDKALLFAGGAIAMMPPLVVFAVLQPSLIQGLTVGALRDYAGPKAEFYGGLIAA